MENRGEHSWNNRTGETKINSQNKTGSMITMNTNTKTQRYGTGRNRRGTRLTVEKERKHQTEKQELSKTKEREQYGL